METRLQELRRAMTDEREKRLQIKCSEWGGRRLKLAGKRRRVDPSGGLEVKEGR